MPGYAKQNSSELPTDAGPPGSARAHRYKAYYLLASHVAPWFI